MENLARSQNPYVLESTLDVLSTGRRCVAEGYAFQWTQRSLHPIATTLDDRIVRLVSRDLCPFLDGDEPTYSFAAPAFARPKARTQPKNTVARDPRGPQYHEPKPSPRPSIGGSTNARSAAIPDAYSANSCTFERGSSHQRDNCGSGAKAQPWKAVGMFNPKPVKLNLSGAENISRHLLDVNMVSSAEQAVTGDGVCIGLTY